MCCIFCYLLPATFSFVKPALELDFLFAGLIEADYLLSTPFENSDIYIFIAEHKDTGKYFCRSFFPKEKKDYTEGQPRYTMLYKEKRNMATGEIAVQYDRLTPKNQP